MMIDYTNLIEISTKRIRNTKETFVRSIDKKINWDSRLIGIKGARGCGKTTLLLQHLKNNHMDLVSTGKALFVSLDNIWFAKNSLLDLADSFSKNGGKILYFDEYLKTGYYPFFMEEIDTYYMKLEETVNMILEVELPILRKIEIAYVSKLKKLLAIIAETSPFMLNISKIAGAMELNRTTLLSYLKSLTDAKLIESLYKDLKSVSSFQKPDKIFLENTNLMYLYQGKNVDAGNVRETFLVNQLSYNQTVEFSEISNFFVNGKYTIECVGKSKTGEQIKSMENAFVTADGIETGVGSKIPLWLFGFLY